MKKVRNFKFISLGCILVIALVLIGFQALQAQMKTQAKGGKGKPPAPPEVICNYDGICISEEFNSSFPHEEQPCLDCAKIYGPLSIITENPIISWGWKVEKLFLWEFNGQSYIDTWASPKFEWGTDALIGDIDGDVNKEIVLLSNHYSSTGKGKNKISSWYQKITIFHDNSENKPEYSSALFGDGTRARGKLMDVNKDTPEMELVLRKDGYFEIYSWNGNDFELAYTSDYFGVPLTSFDVGNADNLPGEELVIGTLSGQALVLKWLGGYSWGDEILTENITATGPITDNIYINHAIIADVENDGLNEIIAGGSNCRLMIWKYINGVYKTVFISVPFEGFTDSLDAGNLDGDISNGNEIFVCADYQNLSHLFVYNFESDFDPIDPLYNLILRDSLDEEFGVTHSQVINTDGDLKDEIVLDCTRGGIIYDFDGIMEKRFESIYLSYPSFIK